MALATGTRLAGILTFAFCMTSENMKARSISKLLACAAGRVPLDPDHQLDRAVKAMTHKK